MAARGAFDGKRNAEEGDSSVAERKALRESEERFRTLFNAIDEAHVVLEAAARDEKGAVTDFRFVLCNPAFTRQTGLPDATGKMLLEALPELNRQCVDRYAEVLETGVAIRFEEYIEPLERWLDIFAARLEVGEKQQVALIFRDVTERRASDAAADKLAAAQELWRIVVESAQEHAIITTDLQRRVLTWNAGAQKIMGYTAEEMAGKSADIIFTEEDRRNGRPEREVELVMEKGQASDNRWHLRKSGSLFYANGAMMPLRARPGGELLGFVKIIRDETESEQAKEELEEHRKKLVEALSETLRARTELEAASQAKDKFLAVLSHELRTPLTPVLMAVRTLARRSDLPAPVREALEMIQRNVMIEARFIDDLLDVTRIARGKMEVLFVPLDFHDVARSAAEISRPDMEAKKQRLTLELADADMTMQGDPDRLQQVIWNLLKNASKFTPEGGEVTLRVQAEAESLRLEVRDTGMGIPPEAMEQIFEAFEQASEHISRQFGGLGLGLAISRAIIEAHGGRLWVESEGLGKGSTFFACLPRKQEAGER